MVRPFSPIDSSTSSPTKEAPASQEVVPDLSQMTPWREYAVILFNDDEHSFEEVITQLLKALHCSPGRAYELTLRVHNEGRATVAVAGRERALQIASILKQIDLKVALRQLN